MSRRASGWRLALAALGAAALVLIAWRGVLDLALLGWDSYPLILAGRIQSSAELAGTFSEELMDGAYPLGRFWRPLVHLAFAADHALWGLEPTGYHATDLGLAALGSAALVVLAWRLLGGAALAAPLLAGALCALHPVQLEILPVPARRAESLAVLFTLLALIAQPAPGEPRRRAWIAGLCCALALASKETGAMAAGLVVALALASAPGAAWGSRIAAAVRAAGPSLVGLGAAAAARTAALAGLGGSAESSVTAHVGAVPEVLREHLSALVAPSGTPLRSWPFAAEAALALLVGTLALLVRSRGVPPRAAGETERGLAPGRIGQFLLLAALAVATVTSVSGVDRGWYALPFLPLLCLALALAFQLGLRALAVGPRAAGASALALAAALSGNSALASLRGGAIEPLRRASLDHASFLERFDAAVAGASDGTRLSLAGLPTERRSDPLDPDSPNVLMLAPYSVAAYAALRFPERAIRLELAGRPSAAPPGPGELVVVLAP